MVTVIKFDFDKSSHTQRTHTFWHFMEQGLSFFLSHFRIRIIEYESNSYGWGEERKEFVSRSALDLAL